MGGLSHTIQRAGVPTTGISLIRLHTEGIRPPRALWVPFPLGRPYGVPGDADFQREVLRAVLRLLETATEPTIEDYPIDAPIGAGPGVWACPIALPSPEGSELAQALRAEVDRLRPWYEENRRARGRTTFGMSGATPEEVDAVVAFVLAFAEGHDFKQIPAAAEGPAWSHQMPVLLRHAIDDLRAYYQEAVAAQPGPESPSHQAFATWLFKETALGQATIAVGQAIADSDEQRLKILRGFIIPEGHWEGEHSWGKVPEGMTRREYAVATNAFIAGDDD